MRLFLSIVAKSDGTVIDGHLRLKAAKRLGLEIVPVLIADDLSEAEVKAFRLLANESAQWAEWDEALLKTELEALKELDFSLELTGVEPEAIEGWLEGKITEAKASVETYMPFSTSKTSSAINAQEEEVLSPLKSLTVLH